MITSIHSLVSILSWFILNALSGREMHALWNLCIGCALCGRNASTCNKQSISRHQIYKERPTFFLGVNKICKTKKKKNTVTKLTYI